MTETACAFCGGPTGDGGRWGARYDGGLTGYTRSVRTCRACKGRADDYDPARAADVAESFIPAGGTVTWHACPYTVSSLAPNRAGYWLSPAPGSSCQWVDKAPLEQANPDAVLRVNRYGERLP